MRFELPLGLYDVRLSLDEHYESEAQIDVSESGEMPEHISLHALGTVRIKVEPRSILQRIEAYVRRNLRG